MTETEMLKSYKHFSERKIPFEDKIIDIVRSDNIPYSDRKRWIENLSFILEKGYYIRYKDFYAENTHYDENDNEGDFQPFPVYLDGVSKIAYIYAFNASVDQTISFMLSILSKGIFCVSKISWGKHAGKLHFTFSLPWYSWIGSEYRNN